MIVYILLYHHNDINNDEAEIESISTNYKEIKKRYNEIKKDLQKEDLIVVKELNDYIKFTDEYQEKLYELSLLVYKIKSE